MSAVPPGIAPGPREQDRMPAPDCEASRLREALATACGNFMNLVIDAETTVPRAQIAEHARAAHRRARAALTEGQSLG